MQDSSGNPSHGGNLAWAASLAGCSPLSIVDFSASINPLGPPPSAICAIQTHLNHLAHYPDPNYRTLRQALANFHQLDPDWILPGNGSAELLTWAGRELAALGSTYLITPAFGDYLRALNGFGATVVGCPLKLPRQRNEEWGMNGTCAILSRLPLPDLHGIDRSRSGVLLNNPHNPTGQLYSTETLLPLLDQFALVVVDEAFMDFLPPGQEQTLIGLIQQYPNLVILRSLTKFYSLPGLRLGYAITHPDRLHQWHQWRDPWTVNVLAEAAAIAVLHDHPFQLQTWNWLKTARSKLYQGLTNLPGLSPLPGAANFLLVHSDASVIKIQRNLLQRHHILIRDCMSFPELGDRYFRVAVRTIEENQRLLDGLADILSADILSADILSGPDELSS